ncbi:MAG: PilZ domain-containing protein [Sphingomonas sp.]
MPLAPIPAFSPAEDQRPREVRQPVTTLLVARVVSAGGDGLCRLRNLSPGGAKIETLLPLSQGEWVDIDFRSATPFAGRVAWTAAGAAGIQFLEAIDCDAFLSPRVAFRSWQRRPPRLATACNVIIKRNGRMSRGRMVNIGQRGCALEPPTPLESGDDLVLDIPGLGSQRAVVRWAEGEQAGLYFPDPLSYQSLGRWLQTEHRFNAGR